MGKHSIKIIQVFKDTRMIEIDVDAENEDEAIENVAYGAIDTPVFDDPRWKAGWDLQNEEVEPA